MSVQHRDSLSMASTVCDLSHTYVKDETLRQLIQTYTELSAASSPASPLPSVLSFDSSVLVMTAATSQLLHTLIYTLRFTLQTLILCKSNLTGKPFLSGHTVVVSNEDRQTISVESRRGKPASGGAAMHVVRDEVPPLHIDVPDEHDPANEGQRRATKRYAYVHTAYDEATDTFTRLYTQVNWLHLTHLNVSATDISSYGLATLLIATAHTLHTLKLNECVNVDDHAIITVAQICTQIRHIELNFTPNITPAGIMALSELTTKQQIAQLQFISTCQTHIPYQFFVAFYRALEDREWTGTMHFDSAPTKQVRGNEKNATLTHQQNNNGAAGDHSKHELPASNNGLLVPPPLSQSASEPSNPHDPFYQPIIPYRRHLHHHHHPQHSSSVYYEITLLEQSV